MLKTLLKVVAGIVVLVLIAVAGFVYTFDANRYKEELTDLAEAISGRSMHIDGDVHISLYPWLGIEIHDVTIDNPVGFSNESLATVGQFDVSIKIVPLLQKRLEIDKLVLHHLDIALEKNAAGQYNWTDDASAAENEPVASKLGLAGFSIGGIDIEDSSLSWLDKTSGKQIKISRLNLATEAMDDAKSLPLEMKAYIESAQPKWQAAVKANTTLDFSGGEDSFNADDLKLVVKALLPGKQVDTLSFALVADSAINVRTQRAKLNKARFSALGLVASGTFDVENLFSVPVIQGPLKVKQFEAEKLAKRVNFELPPMADPEALKNISLTALFKTDFDTVQLDDIAANIDQSRIKGSVHIAAAPVSMFRYKLEIDQLDLNNYAYAEKQSQQSPTQLPLDLLRAIGMEGELAIDSFSIGEHTLNELHIASQFDNGVVKVNPISTRVGAAEVRAVVQLDVRETPATEFVANVRNLNADDSINPLLKDILGNSAFTVDGTVKLDANIKASGSSLNALKQSARGVIEVNMDKVVVHGIDFDHASRSVVLDYAKRNDFRVSRTFKTEHKANSATAFNGLSATFKVAGGKLRNNDLSLVSDALSVSGEGTLDFVNAKLDYRPTIDMNVSNTINIRDKLRDHPMQYHAHGPLGTPVCNFDADKYDLWVGRLMIQEAKAHRNRRINSQSDSSWQNAISTKRR